MTYTVLGEDFAALAGLAVAAIGIFISHQYNLPQADGAASIAIGMILAGVAVLLIREAPRPVDRRRHSPDTAAAIRELLGRHPLVRSVGPLLSMYIGPEQVLLTLDVEFDRRRPPRASPRPSGRSSRKYGHASTRSRAST
jgi:divalent metal cation (Fe/Co/Zn/Cd) transporter